MASADSSSTPAVPKGTAAALQLVKCKVSASLLPGNLVAGSRCYAYIHRSECWLVESKLVALGVEKADSVKVAYTDKDALNQVDFVKLPGLGEVIVLLNQAGAVFVFDETGQKLLHTYRHSKSSSGAALTLKEQHLRGVAFDGKDTLYVGSGNGDLLVFQLNKSKLALLKVVPDVHSEASATGGGISALTYSLKENVLVSGDDYGHVAFWAAGSAAGGGAAGDISASKVTVIPGSGSPVNVLEAGHGLVLAAFASGHVRMYDPSKRQLQVEVCAHTRAINALDLHKTKPMFLAASEDTFVSVWTLPTASAPQIKHLMAESPVLGLLTGCRFAGANQELIATLSYDSRSVALMHTP